MSTPEEKTSAPATDAPEPSIMDLARQADAETDQTPAAINATTPATTEPTDPAAASADDKAGQKPNEPAKQPDEDKSDKSTPYEKSKKDAERRDKSWKALEAEKAEVRAERARLEAEKAALQSKPAAPRQTGPAKDKHGLTSQDYKEMAQRYEDEGNDEMAKAARERAETLAHAPADQSASQPGQSFESPEFQAEWKNHVAALVKEDPSLADPNNGVVKAANLLTTDKNYGRFFRSAPDGIRAAVEVARIMQTAQQAETLKTEVTKTKAKLSTAEAEITRLTKLLSPRGSNPAGPDATPKAPEQMDSAAVRAIAAAADRGEIT